MPDPLRPEVTLGPAAPSRQGLRLDTLLDRAKNGTSVTVHHFDADHVAETHERRDRLAAMGELASTVARDLSAGTGRSVHDASTNRLIDLATGRLPL